MRKKLTIDKKALALYGLSFLIPLCLMAGCMYLLKITPFGKDSLLLIDSSSQYVNYLGYFRNVLRGNSSLFYTFSKNLGGDFLSLAAYYMLSPFNFLFALGNTRNFPLVFTAVVLLKQSACGFTYYYASARFYGHKGIGLAFSTAYALMGYTMIYQWNIMWLDGVMILPLLFLGLYRLCKDGKIGLYALCIAYALITSFYTGYMLCAASVIFFLSLLAIQGGSRKDLLGKTGRFAYASCMGGFAAAVIWLPAVLTLGGNRIALEENPMAFYFKLNLLDFPAKFAAGAANTVEIYEGMPHVFCGMLVLLLVLLFFGSRDIPKKLRLTALAVIVLFLASFCINPLDVAWHGFSPNRLFNYRYAFIFTFVLIQIAQYGFHAQKAFPRKQLLSAGAVLCLLLILGALRREDLAIPGVLVSLPVLAAILCCLASPKLRPRTIALMLSLITILELGANCYLTWDNMREGTLKLNYVDYYSYVDYAEPAIHSAKYQEDGFYRMEKTFFKDQNDPMLFDYNGLSHFSSTEKTYVMEFLEKMGLRNYFDVWSAYLDGSTADVDALLGIKYLLSQEDQTAAKGYELVDNLNGIGVYRNPNALPVAMLADPALKQVSMEDPDYFALHNRIWSGLTGADAQILLRESSVVPSLVNLTDTVQADGTHLYTKTDPKAPACARFEITISRDLPLYYYFTAPVEEQPVTVYLNGESDGAYFNAYRWNMACAGTYAPGESLIVELVPENDSFVFDEGWFYYEDRSALSHAAAQVKETPVSLTHLSDSHFRGSFDTETDRVLFFTIPWEEGWHLTLDGQDVPFEKALDTFLSVSVEPGSHTFDMYFLPRGIEIGGILTVLSALMAIAWCVTHRKKKEQ